MTPIHPNGLRLFLRTVERSLAIDSSKRRCPHIDALLLDSSNQDDARAPIVTILLRIATFPDYISTIRTRVRRLADRIAVLTLVSAIGRFQTVTRSRRKEAHA